MIDARRRAVMWISARPRIPARSRTASRSRPGIEPCTELETRAGTWRYDANRTGPAFFARRSASRPALRNGEGFAFDSDGRSVRHAARPRPAARELAEALHSPSRAPTAGGRAGAAGAWRRLRLARMLFRRRAAEAGAGAGIWRRRRQGGRRVRAEARAGRRLPGALGAQRSCDLRRGRSFPRPIAAARSSPSTARGIGRPSRRGATTWCSSRWRTAKPAGNFVVFADGFAGAVKEPGAGRAPAIGTCGRPRRRALHFGRQAWPHLARRLRGGAAAAGIAPAPAPSRRRSSAGEVRAAGRHPSRMPAPRPRPRCRCRPARQPQRLRSATRIFHGQVDGGTCAGCHGSNAKGTPLAPDLTSGKWLWGDGSLASITPDRSQNGVPQPKKYRSPMPPMGGAQLSRSRSQAVAAYVWAISHRDQHTEK